MLRSWDVPPKESCKMYEGTYRGFTLENMNRILNFASEGDTYFNPLCRIPDKEYKSDNICAHNVAEAMIAAKKFLTENVSPDSNDWVWGNLIVTHWNHRVWSNVPPLRPYFDRYEKIPGNANTLWVAEYGICKMDWMESRPVQLKAGKVTAYAHIVTMEPDKLSPENNIYGITGGLNEFPLTGDYDNGIAGVMSGDMWQMKHPEDYEDGLVLKLEPKQG